MHDFSDADETRHPGVAVESWFWWATSDAVDVAVWVGLELRGRRFDYWCGVARRGHPYLYVEELDGTGLRDGLEIKPPEMWADHQCDVPHRQWSVGNEAHGVLIDDLADVWHRPFGIPVPVTVDMEWYADGEPHAVDVNGYAQRGSADVRVELTDGVLEVVGPATRLHTWGSPVETFALPPQVAGSMSEIPTMAAPYRRRGSRGVHQLIGASGVLVAPASTMDR